MTRSCSASPIAATPRRPAADVKAGRRPPAGLGLDTGENRRILSGYEHPENRNTLTTITHIMPMSGRRWTVEGMCHAWRRFGELTPAVALDGAHE
jgi:hypothetical protein